MRSMNECEVLRPFAAALFAIGLLAGSLPLRAQTAPPTNTIEKALEGAKKVGEGVVAAYSKGDATLLVLPKTAFERLFLWYAEFVSVPTGVINHLNIGGATVQFERHRNRVFIRDLTAAFGNRVAARQDPLPGQPEGAVISRMELSVRRANEPPVIGILPVVASAPDGRVLVDVSKLFADDIETMSVRPLVLKTGLMPAAVNPQASYITSVRVFPENFNVRAHLTFVAKDPKHPELPPRGVSLRVGHSLIMLPVKPMTGRQYDPRVGYFITGASVLDEMKKYTEYESESGHPTKPKALIERFRLEKKNPAAAVSDPVKPIVYYIGREVPARWRPYIKAAVEMWEPVFRAAGFSNAILARDAPSFSEDPNWTPEDVRHNTIRWLAQPNPNATGPHIVDPRSGEILAAHIEVWPEVISVFSRYYFAVMGSLDERVNTLPFSEELQGRLLQYAVGHEVGHTLGLRHNHIASTAYTVAQMRDPAFANKWGANSSIMAYGRFNQAAQPGDGITKFIPGIGPYDYYAIDWGYGVHGKTSQEEEGALDALATKAQTDRQLIWAAGELPGETELWSVDPRVLKENTGADRVEATRLGVANIARSLAKLDAATKGDDREFTAAFAQFQSTHMGFLKSVAKLVGGVEANPFTTAGPRSRLVPPEEQWKAVSYLLGDGARSLDAYKAPSLAGRASVVGVQRAVEELQGSLIAELFEGPRLALLESEKGANPDAYGLLTFAEDSYDALWDDLSEAPRWRRALQRAYLARLADIFKAQNADPAEREKAKKALIGKGMPTGFAAIATATGADTVFPAWARDMLPKLAARLEEAAKSAKDQDDRLHFLGMAARARHVAQAAK